MEFQNCTDDLLQIDKLNFKTQTRRGHTISLSLHCIYGTADFSIHVSDKTHLFFSEDCGA